jgi:beta-mannosidase
MARKTLLTLTLLLLPVAASAQGKRWLITLEEPTGIERRDYEVVRLDASFDPSEAFPNQLRIIDPQNRELPIQVAVAQKHPDGSIKSAEILFPATLIPGQRPRFTLLNSRALAVPQQPNVQGGSYQTDILVRRVGTSRLEIGNSRFGVIIDIGKDKTTPAIVEAYNRTSGEMRTLNLVETSPDIDEPLSFGIKSAGWGTALQGVERTAGFEEIEIIEEGPLRARVRLKRARYGVTTEDWEFEWYSNSPVLVWRTRIDVQDGKYGFFFSAVSASPYEPFTHWAVGRETGWPDGWETDNPPHVAISPRDLDDLPGHQILYYNPSENYGALSLIELDTTLKWTGIGSRQFYALKEVNRAPELPGKGISAVKRPDMVQSSKEWSSQIAIGFPRWRGNETLLETRATYRKFAQPVLANVSAGLQVSRLPLIRPAERQPSYKVTEVRGQGPQLSTHVRPIELLLNGSWKLHHAEKGDGERLRYFEGAFDDSKWQSVQVPGSVHTQILKYPAYYTRDAEWISFKEWWYRRSFRVPASMKGRRIRLQFEATDYYADIWLNGKPLGRHEGYIDPFAFEVDDKLLLDNENTIAVRVWTPVDYYWRHRPYTVKGSYGAVDQKPDDITALGITRSVRLLANGPVIIEDLTSRPSINRDGSANVDVKVTLHHELAQRSTGRLELTLAPRNFAGDSLLKAVVNLEFDPGPGKREVAVRFGLQKPELWWTWDHGRPNLYTLSAQISLDGRVSDSDSHAVGIREIEKVGWVFYLNGRRIYIRGTNSYYLELFMSEMNRQKYERDIKLMKDMNVNMIRLHCHFQNPEFYDLCDELGILVWQDYLEAWYPQDPEFALLASRLYDPLIRMVRNHPSVAIWATSDEEDLENYRVLTKHLAPRIYVNDPQQRAVVRSTGRYGDGHIYYGWYGGNIWEYTKTEEKFISELGATALPDYETLIQFLPHHWPIEDHREDWIFRKLQITEAMKAWGRPDGMTLREYIPRTQAYVARLHQLAIERMRRRKYDAGGILHFHAIDFWPSVTMAALDYFRRPTKSYSTVQRSFQMVLASLEYDREIWKVGEEFVGGLWIINDHWFSIPRASVKWSIVDANNSVINEGTTSLEIAEDSTTKLEDLKWKPTSPGKFELRTSVFDGEGKRLSENIYQFEVK